MQAPPLPSQWPYPPRDRAPEPRLRAGAELPGLGGGWRLVAAPDLAFGPAAGLDRAFGRGGVLRAGPVVLRPYRRGGLVRHLNGRIYASPARFRREFQVHRALWAAGLPTVEPLGWACRRRLWGWEGVYLTRWTEGVAWPRAWERSQEVLPALRVLLEALCAWGLRAPDLNATNILVRPDGTILALDWDRAGWSSRDDLMDHYRDRLVRSLAKLGAPPAIAADLLLFH